MRPSLGPEPVAHRVREWPFGIVLGAVAVGLATVYLHHFRLGGYVIALALLIGAGFRLVLPQRQAGLLVVRSRAFDVATLVALGIGMLVFTIVVPSGPAG